MTKSHQRKIREEMAAKEGAATLFGNYWEKIDTDIKNAKIKYVSYDSAKSIILDYEWLGTMAASKHHWGIFFDGYMGGCVCYSQSDGWTHRTVEKYNVPLEKLWVLSRGACVHWAPKHAGSWLIGNSLKELRNLTGAEVVIAYADPDAGEIGTLYQATNWFYIGIKKINLEGWISPDGKVYHSNLNYDMRRADGLLDEMSWSGMKKKLLSEGWTTYKLTPKHRYLYVFNKRLRKTIAEDALPYPKRVSGCDGRENHKKT